MSLRGPLLPLARLGRCPQLAEADIWPPSAEAGCDPQRLSAVQTFRVAKSLFDNLVGADQQRFWDGETDRLGGL